MNSGSASGAFHRRIPPRPLQPLCERHGGLLRTCEYCAAIARIRALEEKWLMRVNFPAFYSYIDSWAPSDFKYVQGGDGNPFVTVQASTAELAEYKCFRDTVVTNRTLYSFRRKPPLFWQSVRAFFWNEGVVVQLSTPETAINVDVDGGGSQCASSDSSNNRDMVQPLGLTVKVEEDWEGMDTDADGSSYGSEAAVIGSSP